MKKFLLFIVAVIVVLVVAVLISGLTMPTEIVITRSILIKAPKDSVFSQMSQFRNWNHWNPWHALDTNIKLTYAGTDGTVGSSYTWDSKISDVGSGTTSNTAINGTQMDFHIDFTKPYKNTADGCIKASDSAGMVKATWVLRMHCPFPMNGLQLFPFMNMQRLVGDAFEKGLGMLKKYSESHVVIVPAIPIKEVDYPAHIFLGMRQTVSFMDLTKFFAESYSTLRTEKVQDKTLGPAAGLFYTWDTATKTTDAVAALPLSDSDLVIKGSVYIYQPPTHAFNALLKGDYSGSKKIHDALAHAVAAKGKTRFLVIEEYLVGPLQETDSTKWVTSIYYLVK